MDNATAPRMLHPKGPGSRGPAAGGAPGRFALPFHQLRRAIREPRRVRRLHPSVILASLRSIVEPDEREFVCAWFGIDRTAFRSLELELLADADFIDAIEARHRDVRGARIRLLGRTAAEDHDRAHRLLYYCARIMRPSVVVETGVFDGVSSAFLLKALDDNRHGRLCSIDLPARAPVRASTDKMAFDTLPAGVDPGWLVPDVLRGRWTLRLGASRELLEPWLAELGTIDLFFHDSLHTHENMTREYGAAWPHLRPGGLLLSDDVFWSAAFRHFARRVGGGRILRGVGFLRKPHAGDPWT